MDGRDLSHIPGNNSTNNPHISVVISVKNRFFLLKDCLEALLRQTIGVESFEVIVVDNVSQDDIAGLCTAMRAQGLQLRYLRMQHDKGPAPARNRGVLEARAPLIAFTDSDCRPHPEWLALGIAALADPAVAFSTGPVLPKPEQTASLCSKLTFVTAQEHPTFPTANMVVRKSVFDAFGGFDETLSFRDPLNRATECADTDLAWRIIEAGYTRRFEPRAVIWHEIEQQSLLQWILEPTRLFLVPALVKRHPELRRRLLVARLFFYPPIWLLYLAVCVAAFAVIWQPLLLLVLPPALLARGIHRTGSVDPRQLAAHAGRVIAHLPRMVVMITSLLYGSIRYRALVL
ncbi:glycosyl transferase family 2 [Methylobacterium sp. 4-46]|uniref:glycosyltransferase family 2 protein n=1 Tax=unclassified Methylobacterium TaxID=2615210 RepID=UPI000152D7EA|nr:MULTISPECIES: glycosyltransferase [Methylobacterium]ACA18398.1 glycosyl transferase family 2 [Methylobacterium sp. 4-46]WFT77688.1 glycosyltransferase [Methylobacterium nodulans]